MSTMNTWLDGLAAAGTIVTALGLLLGIRHFRTQMNAQTFLTYTERYEKIFAELPPDARAGRFDEPASLGAFEPVVQQAFLRYFNLCSEEFYLWKRGYLDRKIWDIWQAEIRRTARSPLGRRMWTQARPEFVSYPEFLEWMEQDQVLEPTVQAASI
jgi:hypothetical protein